MDGHSAAPPPRGAASARREVLRDLAPVLLLALPLLACGLANHRFWLSDEPFVAEGGRELAGGAGWGIPRLNGAPFLEKPPLHYALVAGAFRLFGVTPFAARIPSLLGGLLTVIATYFLGRRTVGRRAGRWAALLVPTFFQIFHINHYCLVDATLVPAVTLGMAALAYGHGADRRPWAITVAYAAAALAFCAKGFVGPGFILLTVAALFFAEPRVEPVRLLRHGGFLLIPAAAALWSWLLWRAGGPPWLREGLFANSLGRMFAVARWLPRHDTLQTHASPLYYYLAASPGIVAPWTPAMLFLLLPRAWRRPAPDPSEGMAGGRAFLAVALLVNFAALSFMHAKRSVYLAPLFPLLACLIAAEADAVSRPGAARSRLVAFFAGAQALFAGACAVAVALSALYITMRLQHREPETGLLATTGLLLLATGGALAESARRLRLGDLRGLFRLAWCVSALSLTVFSVDIFPRLDEFKSFHRFFARASAVHGARGATPWLALDNESYTGFACLHYRRTLPEIPRAGPVPAPEPGETRWVIADAWGLARLRESGLDARQRIVEEIFDGHTRRALHLLELAGPPVAEASHPPGPPPAPEPDGAPRPLPVAYTTP